MTSLDNLILARIQEKKHSDPGSFSSESSLNLHDFQVLLAIILSADESLPSLDSKQCQSALSTDPLLFFLLGEAYSNKSFSEFVKHPSVRRLASSSEHTKINTSVPMVKSSSNKSLQEAFDTPYQGSLPEIFIDVLSAYSEAGKRDFTLYNKSISIIQSSGMGKSRLVQEAANQVFTIPANLREDLKPGIKAFPPPDTNLRAFFMGHRNKSDDLLQAEHAIILANIFIQAKDLFSTVPTGEDGNAAKAWGDYLREGETDTEVGKFRKAFFSAAVDKARKELSEVRTVSVFPAIPGVSEPVPFSKLENPEKQLADLFSAMRTRAMEMLQEVERRCPARENSCFLYFDEAHGLTEQPEWIIPGIRIKSPYHNLGTVLAGLCSLPIFFIFLSTNTQLYQFAPPADHHPSARVSQGDYLIPPFTESSFDVFEKAQEEEETWSLVKACTTEMMSTMGRPLWFAHHKLWKKQQKFPGYPNVHHVLQFAGQKLSANGVGLHVLDSELAALGVRIGINFESTTRTSREMESRLVESHMRVVYAIPEHREYMRTGSPSEPVLAEAAANYLHASGGGIATEGPRILADSCKNQFLARGERGELCGRLITTIAHDIAVLDTPAEVEKLLEDTQPRFHRPVPVLAFLRALFAVEHHDTVLKATPITEEVGKPTLEEAFKDAFVCFSHFALAADSAMLNAEHLQAALFRGVALQAKNNQYSIDAVIPIHMGSITNPITPDTTSAINLQFKNRQISQPCSVDRSITVSDPNQPVISIVLELGEEQPGPSLVDAHHWNIPVTRNTQPGSRGDDNHYSFVVRGCGPSTYNAVPKEAIGSYDIILASGRLKDDFPRNRIDACWALVEGMKPELIGADILAHWYRCNPGAKKPSGSSAQLGTKVNSEGTLLPGNDEGRKRNWAELLKPRRKTGLA